MNSAAVMTPTIQRLITCERVAAAMLVAVIIGMLTNGEKTKSAKMLLMTCIISCATLLIDAWAYACELRECSQFIGIAVNVLSYLLPPVILAGFALYIYAFIEERTKITKAAFIVPVGLMAGSIIISAIAMAKGELFAYDGTRIVSTGTLPIAAYLLDVLSMLFVLVMIVILRKQVRTRDAILLAILDFVALAMGILAITGVTKLDYTILTSSFTATLVHLLVQNSISREREQHRKALEEREAQLRKANADLERAMEETERANRAKTHFLFNMSHDIRTPMNAIIGYTELLEKNYKDAEKTKEYAEKIHASSEFLLSIINNVLEMSRIESGKTELNEEPHRVGGIVGDIIAVYEELMHRKGIEFEYTANVKQKYIYCDRVKMNQIFMNLVSNAYKYTPEGGRVSVRTDELPCRKPGYVLIRTEVKDTGVGMSKEYLPHMFEEFSRERTSTEDRTPSTGLGMPIVKRLTEMMGGTIEVDSEPGVGTRIAVTLQHRIAENIIISNVEETQESSAVLRGKRILLAEDNETNAEITVEILRQMGTECEVAQDGIICVDMLQKAAPGYYDLVLMDVQMPHMNGYEATQRIRGFSDKAKARIPIIAVTANAFKEDCVDAAKAGMNGHLAKPIDINKMQEMIAEVLR